ncbi:MAG: nitroreductase family protein [Muribaculaceae bacterium]|nr:nitroreductase family protein [Muribaculaceae bacterium]
MDFHNLLLERHSIRRYTDQPIDSDDVKTILEAALLAPSSKSKRPWQFIVVEDADVLAKLSKAKKIASHPIAGAKLAVVVVSNPELSDVFIEDTSIAAVFMQLQAAALGIGSCWIQIRNRFSEDGEPAEVMVQQLLDIPQYLPVECIITFGYSAESRKPVDPDKLLWEKIHIGTWKDLGTTE